MFEKFSRSWELVKVSGEVLSKDKQLLVFPLVSSIATGLVALTFILPLFATGMGTAMLEDGFSPASYIGMFLFYLLQYFVIFYFNAALIGAVMIRLSGGTPTLGAGLAIANSKLGAIFGYAMIAATVGLVLRAIEERLSFVGSIITAFIGVAWTLAAGMVVPILVSKDIGPVDAVKESAMMLKQTWGENIIGNAGIGMVFGVAQLLILAVGAGFIFLAISAKSLAGGIFVGVLLVVALLFTGLIQMALTGIYSAALYRFASSGEGVLGFDKQLLGNAFAAKD
jgi:hypothetical protein